MNPREAFLAAADHIERRPESYNFMTNGKPSPFSRGCMVSWAGVYAGVTVPPSKEHRYAMVAANKLVGTFGFPRFAWRIIKVARMLEKQMGRAFTLKASGDAVLLLRAYVATYHQLPHGMTGGIDPAYAKLRTMLLSYGRPKQSA